MMVAEEKVLDIQNLTIRTQRGRVLVDGISLNLHKGEILGVVGESGSGKTLTAKTILNLLPENISWEADKFVVLGADYLTLDQKDTKALVGKKIGYVPQNTGSYLHPMIRIKDQIIDGYLRYTKNNRGEAIERAKRLVKAVGIRDTERLLKSYSWQLSGGMRQRVNIAMALMNKPQLIVADEPTTALDSTIQMQVLDLLKTVNDMYNTPVILVSHDLGLVKYYCERIIVMYAGQIMEEAPVEKVFSDPKHPYTKALIKVIPSLNIKKGERLAEIPEQLNGVYRAGEGCTFKERCSFRQDACECAIIEKTVAENHHYRCNLNF